MPSRPFAASGSGGSAIASSASHRRGWIEALARTGYAAKGGVYILVGVLAVEAALGSGGAEGSRQALGTLAGGTVGRVILGIVAVGLVAYALWCAIRSALDPENEGTAARGVAGIVALIYAALALQAGRLALGGTGGGSQGGQGARHWSAQLMAEPAGRWLVAAVGAAIAAYGLQQLVHAWRVELDRRLDLSLLSARARGWIVRASRFGLAARGIVFGLIGAFFVTAAVNRSPGQARGLGGTLRALQGQPYGPWLLAVVALGLIAYGVYNLVRARYRRMTRV